MIREPEPHEFERCKYAFNDLVKANPRWDSESFSFLNTTGIFEFHKSIAGYGVTPLVHLPELAAALGVQDIYVKDESHRFGIKAFKAFGASYAIFRFLKEKWKERYGQDQPFTVNHFRGDTISQRLGTFTFCAATDGNHGRAVAWIANKLEQKALIYMPENTAQSRINNIESECADVVLVPGTFDDCVEQCARDAEKNNWQAISDTAYPGNMEIPKYIMLGYTSIFHEIAENRQLRNESGETNIPAVDFVFLPAGVGGIAAAGSSYYVRQYGANRPKLICVEPSDCDCFLESVKYGKGQPLPALGKQESIMAGLNCGIPSPVAWPIIRDGVHLFIAITDNYAVSAMRDYYKEGVIAGESGAAGLAGLTALVKNPYLSLAKERIGINTSSRILLINTEGDTDPVKFREIISTSR